MARPSTPILSKSLIYRVALGQLDRSGRLSMPELAQELGVSVSSLYHHVNGRTGVLEGIRGILSDWDCGDADNWTEMVRRWAHQYRDAFARHPAAIPVLVGDTVSDPGTLHHYDTLANALREAGFSARSVVLCVSSLDVLCLGAALDAAAPTEVWSNEAPQESVMSDIVTAAQLGPDRSGAAFDLHLTWMIDGMTALLAADTAPVDLGPTGGV